MPRILVVDDDKSVLDAMRVLLELDGHEVVAASSGRDAIQAISSSSFDVALVDIFVRAAGGLETTKALNQHASDVPVIAVSGFLFRDPSAPVLDLPAISPALGAAR